MLRDVRHDVGMTPLSLSPIIFRGPMMTWL